MPIVLSNNLSSINNNTILERINVFVNLRPTGAHAFKEQPVFCFTSDIEWAPEWAIKEMLDLFKQYNIPLTPFVTHDSKVIRDRYDRPEIKHKVGLHPNFLPRSSHGETQLEVIDFVNNLWPEAVGFRSHCFFDNTKITDAFAKRGFKYDSNLCLFLQPNCEPLFHNSGLLRFPVFWEDDIHFRRGVPFSIETISDFLDNPGLKVFNVHPLIIALNVPDEKYYEAHKFLNQDNGQDHFWREFVFCAGGGRDFVESVLEYVVTKGFRTEYLYDLYVEAFDDSPRAIDPHAAENTRAWGNSNKGDDPALKSYRIASSDQKTEMVRDIYDSRDAKEVYATSRDYNLRELEISFIAKHLAGGNILDIGCGNGYTITSLAKTVEANFIGLDFSSVMLEGTKTLTEKFSSELKSIPKFQYCDVRQIPFEENFFDCVISERCLQNLPSREDQYKTIYEIHRVLKNGGVFLMVEGTGDGLDRLNKVREQLGLAPIPPVSSENVSALRFREAEINDFLKKLFEIETIQFFGTYYPISRVVHPLLVHPGKPSFDAKINEIARLVAEIVPDIGQLGHVMAYKLIARK